MLKQKSSGFTLIEVMFFVLFVSLIFIGLIFTSTVSIRNNRVSEHKIIATHYAEELREWLRGQKELDFQTLFNKASDAGITYCFNGAIASWPSFGSCSGSYSLNSEYLRQVVLTRITDSVGNSQVRADITVSFKDGPNVISAKDNALFASWE